MSEPSTPSSLAMESTVVATHYVVAVMEQLADGRVKYQLHLDPATREQVETTPRRLCAQGATLAHLGIRALAWMLREETVEEALDRASDLVRTTREGARFALEALPAPEPGDHLVN